MTEPVNIRDHYREMLLRLRRIRNICNRVKNTTKKEQVLGSHLKASEKRILEKEMPLLGEQLTAMIKGSDKLGLVMYSMTQQFGIDMGMFSKATSYDDDVWMNLRYRTHNLHINKVMDGSRLPEYIDELWAMLELSPTQFSGRLMLFKLKLN